MELYTSRWANQDLAHLDVVPVGISRGVPRWPLPYRYKLLRLLAPNRETFGLQNHRAFETAYVAGLEEIGVEKIAAALAKIAGEHGGKPLVLLCFERTLPPYHEACHRRMFAAYLEEKLDVEVPELVPSTIPATGATQEKLF